VNLSVGYKGEHTDHESLDIKACYQTAKLLTGFFEKTPELRRILNEIRRNGVC